MKIAAGSVARISRRSVPAPGYDRLLEAGVFVVGFGYPVVPEGRARLRVQMSSEHTAAQIERTLDAFAALR